MQKKEDDMKKARGDEEINTIPKGSYEAGITNHALKKSNDIGCLTEILKPWNTAKR